MGIEPTLSAWKAEVLPLNYTRMIVTDKRPLVSKVGVEPARSLVHSTLSRARLPCRRPPCHRVTKKHIICSKAVRQHPYVTTHKTRLSWVVSIPWPSFRSATGATRLPSLTWSRESVAKAREHACSRAFDISGSATSPRSAGARWRSTRSNRDRRPASGPPR